MINIETVYRHSRHLNVLFARSVSNEKDDRSNLFATYFSTFKVADNGSDALQMYNEQHTLNDAYYDLVIIDVSIQDLDSLTLVASMLEKNPKQVFIVCSSGSEDNKLLPSFMDLGVTSFLSTPLQVEPLNKVIHCVSLMASAQSAELKRKEEEEEIERKFLLGVMHLQDNMIVITDGRHIESANQVMLDFFGFGTIENFRQANMCISFNFLKEEGYFHDGILRDGELWIKYILNRQEQDFTVMMKNPKTLQKEVFKVSVNYFYSTKRYIVTFSNITDIIHKNQTDQYKATHDYLTGIYNRHKLNDLLQNTHSSRLEKKNSSCALILFDIDRFKEINDTYGHLIGDKVLKQLTSIVKENIRKDDIFARWGGDEFILVVECISLQRAVKIAEYLRHIIEQSVFYEVGLLTCSFGVSLYQNGDLPDQVINRVDQALYAAKNGGRNRVAYL